MKNEKENSYCCGGSLSNIKIKMSERDKIRDEVLNEYSTYDPDYLVTACPLCKKTFKKGNDFRVFDISKIIVNAIKPAEQDIKKTNMKNEKIYQI
jgi:Fe-S oxidoreductase